VRLPTREADYSYQSSAEVFMVLCLIKRKIRLYGLETEYSAYL